MKKTFRRSAIFLICAILMTSLLACQKSEDSQTGSLKELNWEQTNYQALNKVIETYGKESKDYDENKKPYTVFDWDNTSIMNDVEEALLAYQLMNLEFKMTPDQFGKVLATNLPQGDFVEECNNKAGESVNKDQIIADCVEDYRYLYENYEGLEGKEGLDQVKESWQYNDFKAKMRYLYYAIGETFDSDVSYPWITYLFTGMTSEEVEKLTEASTDYWLKHDLAEETWTSDPENLGQAGQVEVTFDVGLRTVEEMQNLYKTLMDQGIDVYICSASYLDVVKTFASNEKYGYGIDPDKVYAMVLEKDQEGKITNVLDENYFQTQGEGKVKTIDKFIRVNHQDQDPLIVGGDSNGDVAMLSSYPGTQVSLIINRCKGGKIGELCQMALDQHGKEDQRYYLQGRDNNTGAYISGQGTILLGETEAKDKK